MQWADISLRARIKLTALVDNLYLHKTESRFASLWLDVKLNTKSSSTTEISTSCSICPLPINELDPDGCTCTSKKDASISFEFSGVSAGYGVLVESGVFSNDKELSESYRRKLYSK
jgi:hypothetical protein